MSEPIPLERSPRQRFPLYSPHLQDPLYLGFFLPVRPWKFFFSFNLIENLKPQEVARHTSSFSDPTKDFFSVHGLPSAGPSVISALASSSASTGLFLFWLSRILALLGSFPFSLGERQFPGVSPPPTPCFFRLGSSLLSKILRPGLLGLPATPP